MARYRDDDDFDVDDIRIGRQRQRVRDQGPLPHSGLGIASLLISIAVGIAVFAIFAVVVVISIKQNGQINDKDPLIIVLSLGIVGGCGIAMVGLTLGIIGSLQSDRAALCGILGSVFNGMILLGVGCLMCIGIVAGNG